MVTKNFYKMLAAMMANLQDFTATSFTGSAVTMNEYNWETRFEWDKLLSKLQTSANSSNGVVLGDGDTPPTFEDYSLAGNTISNFTFTASINRLNIDNSGTTIKALYTITNNNSAEITIKEIGLIVNATQYSSSNGAEKKIVLDRTVLDTPVTIPSGGVGQVEYTITFNLPTAT